MSVATYVVTPKSRSLRTRSGKIRVIAIVTADNIVDQGEYLELRCLFALVGHFYKSECRIETLDDFRLRADAIYSKGGG